MKVLVTGSDGFIGRNLRQQLAERPGFDVACFSSSSGIESLPDLVKGVEFVIHLAGANRPADPVQFMKVNHALTRSLSAAVVREAAMAGRRIPIILASSTQADRTDSLYGQSKRAGEQVLLSASRESGLPVHIFRLPNVFGKWARPNYNSVVATFCHNVARGKDLDIHDAGAPLTLVHVDDVVARFIGLLDGGLPIKDRDGFEVVDPQYRTTVGALAEHIRQFRASRLTLAPGHVGTGLLRALYSTYLSYLPESDFAYSLTEHRDARGKFVEVLKTPDCGQVSYFTAVPGVTRGGHYHHTKTEKFVVIRGQARFRFRHVQDGREHEIVTGGEHAEIVETVPGWAHDITNIGADELLVMVWANEVFDPVRPDTFPHRTSLPA